MKRRTPFLLALLVAGGMTPAFGDSTISTLVTFDRTNGSFPYDELLLSGGNLYGTTFEGGSGYYGTVFRLTTGTNAFSTLVSFNQANGSEPQAGLMIDESGNLYGTTYEGGATGGGTVFKVTANTNVLSTLATFPFAYPYPAGGTNPQSTLVRDSSGNLYGTTAYGGSNNNGTVFQIAGTGGPIDTLTTFTGPNGQKPVAGLVSVGGYLYGTTQDGGSTGDGTVFKVAVTNHALTTVITFNGSGNGAFPNAALIADVAGNLYGTTTYGGTNDDGTVFEIPANGGPIVTLDSFDGTDGANPRGMLLLRDGVLYGTTENGGTVGDGTVFDIPAAGGSISTLATFDGSNGSQPLAGLVADASGNLYGTTWKGGANDEGTVFELLGVAVPEPGSVSLLSLGAVGLLARRRRMGRQSIWRKE